MKPTFRRQPNGWTIRVDGEELRDEDGKVRRYVRKADAESAWRQIDQAAKKRKTKKKK